MNKLSVFVLSLAISLGVANSGWARQGGNGGSMGGQHFRGGQHSMAQHHNRGEHRGQVRGEHRGREHSMAQHNRREHGREHRA